MPTDAVTRSAIRTGRQQAAEVLKFRAKELSRRRQAVRRPPGSPVAEVAPAPPSAALLNAIGEAPPLGVLVAEGDSWFDYPLSDILRLLEDRHGYDVESVAHKGDRVEQMAYSLGQLEEFTRRIEKLLRRGIIPRAVLLSGGGNDVAGTEFGMLLNHAQSPLAGLNQQVINGVIEERVRLAYVTILGAVTRLCEQRLGRRIPILLHGYDYPVPDGRGFLGGWAFLPGPWLEPGFREKGYTQLAERIALARQLIDRFNLMLQEIAALPDFPHVRCVDLRNTLSTGPNYKRDWADELHPSPAGFARVAARFAAEIAALP